MNRSWFEKIALHEKLSDEDYAQYREAFIDLKLSPATKQEIEDHRLAWIAKQEKIAFKQMMRDLSE